MATDFDDIDDVSGTAFVLDEDDMASNSASKVPTQQSVKAYADSVSAAAEAASQPLDADLTALAAADNSATLAATTAAFTSADEAKLDGIATGATDDTTVDAHIADGTDAHDASAISLADVGAKYTATDVEAALAEVRDVADAAAGGGVDTSGTPVANDFARFTDADTIEGRSHAEVRTDLGLVIGTDVQAHDAVLDATTASFTTADETKLDGIEALADVTDTANVTAAGALMDSEVDADIKTLSLPASTTISTFGASLVDDADAAAARTTLGVDAAGTDNSTDVTLAGTPDYITISGQTITRGLVDLTADVTGDLPVAEGGTGASTAAAARTNLGAAPAVQAINAQTGTTYTLVLSDAGKVVTCSNASAVTLTVPPNSSVAFDVGTSIDVLGIGAGIVTVAAGAGVTVSATPSLVFRAQHSGATLVKLASDTWALVGDLATP